jgi:hypothetical protein
MMHDASVSCESIYCEERKVLEDDDSGDNMENDAAPGSRCILILLLLAL